MLQASPYGYLRSGGQGGYWHCCNLWTQRRLAMPLEAIRFLARQVRLTRSAPDPKICTFRANSIHGLVQFYMSG